ncbi:MAG TPA: PilZ domain-containing protein, partial [Gemmataceae bacterium]|nr:PilZ domain-containing protein [Gemmataceae bacterium]
AALHAFAQPKTVARPAPSQQPLSQTYDPFVHGSATEQRAAHRRTGNPVEVLIRRPGSEGSQLRGYVLDRSTGGLCLRVEVVLEAGALLHVRPVNAPPITPWIEIEVKNTYQTDEGWQLGCQFVRTPPWAMLLMFG